MQRKLSQAGEHAEDIGLNDSGPNSAMLVDESPNALLGNTFNCVVKFLHHGQYPKLVVDIRCVAYPGFGVKCDGHNSYFHLSTINSAHILNIIHIYRWQWHKAITLAVFHLTEYEICISDDLNIKLTSFVRRIQIWLIKACDIVLNIRDFPV